MVILVVVVCSIIYLVARGGNEAFGSSIGTFMIFAGFGLIALMALFALSAIIVPLLMGLFIPIAFIWGLFLIFRWVFFGPKEACK
jgi:hypothetical protein